MARVNDPRRDRKILVAVSLAGSQFARGGHQKTCYILLGFACPMLLGFAMGSRMRTDRMPHIGEYGTKTNAFCGFSRIPAACTI